jgi:hypothetical protein
VTVVIDDRQRRAGGPAGSFASGAAGAILVGMTATLTSPTFVGRTEELARLAAAVERAAGDVPTSVLIGGEAGVGKTRLVGEVVAAARAAGVTVLHGGCVELGGCSSCCWGCWSASAPSARPSWSWRTCTGPTAPPATCSPSSSATCAGAGCCL